MSDSVQPHRRQPARLRRPWDSPGKNTEVGCHVLLQCMKVISESEVAQSCLTLLDSMDCSLSGSSVHGIFQTRVLEFQLRHQSFQRNPRADLPVLKYPCIHNKTAELTGEIKLKIDYHFWIYIYLIMLSGEGNGNPLQSSCLEDPMDRGAWKAAVHGVAKSRTRLSNFTYEAFRYLVSSQYSTTDQLLKYF